MTIKELYEWALAHGVEEYELRVNYRDGGGWYCGDDEVNERDFEIHEEQHELII